tara:strand:- start:93 stop:986 length:894 start_codon:yes stop_codon:yes gene_type:complete
VLLPSDELKRLHQSVPICLSGAELPGNCDIRYGQFYYFFMFNAEGELTDVADMSNGLTRRIRQGMSLPLAFLDMVDESMLIETSLDDCERAYLDSKGSTEAYRTLLDKLKQMERIGSIRVATLLRENADKMDDPVRTRFHALSIEIAAVRRQVINKKAIDSLAETIENFLAQNPGHPDANELLDAYLEVALKYSFDIAARCQAVARKWQENPIDGKQQAARELAGRLIQRCDRHLRSIRGSIKKLKSETSYDAPRLHAQLGGAEKTLDLLEKTQTFGVMRPIRSAWREKAEAKLQER